jgi:acetoin utilization deacetylase AcuC-like enzyme
LKAYYCHQFVLELPPGHRFPMAKYRLLHERIASQSRRLGIELVEPPRATDEDLLRAHSPEYVRQVVSGLLSATELRRIGFPWSPALVERSRRSNGATGAALEDAIRTGGTAVNLAGGTHHAFRDHGAGYCVFNDSVVAARRAQALGIARRVLVVDLDVHQGNGTAALCAGDPSLFTFSMHAERNYPAVKFPSDLDVALPDGCADARYLDLLAHHLPLAIERAQADAAIYLAGADPFAGDLLGWLALSKAGLEERDRYVFETLRRAGLPVAATMGGGYAEDVADIVAIHDDTVRQAAEAARGAGRRGRRRQASDTLAA